MLPATRGPEALTARKGRQPRTAGGRAYFTARGNPIRQLKAQLDALEAPLQVDFRVNVDPFRAFARVMW